MKKILLTMFALLLLGGANSVKAEQSYASFSVATGCTWDSGTNTMGFTDVNGWQILWTGFPGGDITAYKKIHATLLGMSDNIESVRLRIRDKNDHYADVNLVTGENNIDLAALSVSNPTCDFTNINDITIWSPTSAAAGKVVDGEHPASVVITDVYMEKPDPEYFVTYVVKDTNGSTIFTSEAQGTTLGAHITTLPNQFKRGFCEYTSADVTIENAETTVEFTATWDDCPITFYADYASIEWKNLFLNRSKQWYLNNAPSLCLVGDPSNNDRTADSYQWGFVGNPYQYKIYNKAAGSSKTLNESPAMADGETFWTSVAKNDKGILFGRASDGQFLNQSGGDGKTTLGFWGDATDPGSTFFVADIPEYEVIVDFGDNGIAQISQLALKATGGLTYNPSTGALSSDGTAGSLTLEFANPVDLRNLFQFDLANSGSTNAILSRLEFYDEDDTKINTWNSIKLGNKGWAEGIDNAATNAFLNHKPVKKMVWPSDANAENNGKTATITSVEFICKTIACKKAGVTLLKSLPWNKIDGSGTATPDWNMNVSTDTYYGNYSSDPTHYADLTAYEELRIYRDNNDGFRAFFINAAGNGSNTIDSNNAASTWNAEGKYWSIDLSKIEKWDSKVALKSIKSASSGLNNIVNNIVVYQAPAANAPQYILTGSGMQLAETVAALADATATAIDATGVTGITTNSEAGRTLLTSANPNCLFLGTTGNGGLANTKNVITSGTCDNLVLTDGYPFKAPANFTATTASYATTINTTAKAGTLCLPFAATIPSGVKAYTLSYTSGDKATAAAVTGTIPANTPVLLNGSGDVTFTGSSVDIDADADNVSHAMTGVFERTAVPQGSYVLQNQDGDDGLGFYQVANANEIYVNPFRAYMTAGSGSKLRIVYDDATAIEDVKTQTEFDGAIYDLQGRKVAQPTKGIYVKNGRKFIVK